MTSNATGSRRGERGFTLIEVMVAAMTLLLLFFGMAQIFSKSRGQLVLDEDKRNAIAVAQARLESLREDYSHQDLVNIAASDTVYNVGGRLYTVAHEVAADSPEARATTVTVTVNWTASLTGGDITRSLECTTILGRSRD